MDSLVHLLTMRLEAPAFVARWDHCRVVADYLGGFIQAQLGKPKPFAIALSTAFNELLEVVFNSSPQHGDLQVNAALATSAIQLLVSVPDAPGTLECYSALAELSHHPEAALLREVELIAAPGRDHNLRLAVLELSVVHGAKLYVERTTAIAFTLVLPLSGPVG